ncbi:MAG: heavy-metal-associated domain-containing protein [Proteobacteria bacterium]|nr:heavy-metal-associated domain-containing protein [Pseudomonadota bacterium]
METTVLKVTGMSCGGCVKSVTQVLLNLPGVSKAEVSLERGEAVVGYDPDKATRQDMQRVIDEAGFEAG